MTYNDRPIRRRAALFIDVLVSLFRRWVLRPAYREPALSTALAGESADTPLFHMLDNSLPRRSALVNGAILSLVFLSALTFSIGRGARGSLSRVFVHTMIRVLDVLDADHDHIISPWEVSTAPAALRRLDRNHDGKLSPEECGFYLGANPKINLDPLRVQRERLRFMQLNPVLAALDADHDGEISADEIENSSAELRMLDQNHDGSLTPDELLPGPLTIQRR